MFLGIDPGVTGAYALTDESQKIVYMERFVSVNETVNTLKDYQRSYGIEIAALEDVHASPQMGVSSAFTFGKNYGQWQGLLHALNISHLLITPKKWQKAIFDKTTAESLDFCARKYPDVKWTKNHNITDAVCLALYAHKFMVESYGARV